ncbi:arsenical pump-driving ATPase [Oceanobacillus picturae]|uniref:Arsenical pump-driving ATPase n=1 Tax=Oceanobacillus picturae TaxID=171693 RepID=W9AA99_9BACI|nr:ArsA family ATPase [Oceanobacillus picturae]RIU96548.1 ArsA family ATPase [Oceanobacillus picturae]GAQ18739.1 arsenical pump-driving ATPase [Oceanobacillus picturae]CDO02423.1 Arsenical pump-driving ATPase [Oceanobacillus picturae]
MNTEKEIIFIGGKGGVGKSTTAAALAWSFAEKGIRTLLVSTDPAHNTGDIFDQKIGGAMKRLSKFLTAIEIDPDHEASSYIQRVKLTIKGIVHVGMVEEVNRQLDTAKASPGAEEAALFEKLISIILEERANFDKIVFDTAPTGHTIRLLSLPELMGVWIDGLLQKRQKTNENYSRLLHDGEPVDDPIYEVLKARQERFYQAREILLNPRKTEFIFVLNPEKLPILETKKAIELLEKYQLSVNTLVVNKLLPNDVEGTFYEKRRKHEKQYISKIKQEFQSQHLMFVPLFTEDIITKAQLSKFSTYVERGKSN